MSARAGDAVQSRSGTVADIDPVAALAVIFETAPDAIALALHGTLRMANPALARLFGYTDPTQLVGRPVIDLVDPNARPIVMEWFRRRGAGEPYPPVHRSRGLRADGSSFPLEVRATGFKSKGQVYAVSILRSLESEPPREESGRRTDAIYKAVFEVNSAVKLLISPEDGRIVDANQAAAEFYGWSLPVLRTMRITDINTASREEVATEMERARTGHRRYFRFRHRTARGDIRHVEVYSGPVTIDGDQLLFSIIHDVTERDALEEQLKSAQRLEAMGRLAGGVAHDFGNLLTIITNTAQVIAGSTPEDSPLRARVDDLLYATHRANELTHALLAVGRQQELSLVPVSLNEVVGRMHDVLGRTLPAGLQLVCELADELPPVSADPAQLEQVVMNFVFNARDAMPDGGIIRARTALREVTERESTVVPAGEWVTLVVSDEGHGMDEETRAKVFEPFFSTKPARDGTGLGLATVYGIVTQSGGFITVDSELGRGTTFTVFLPLSTSVIPLPPPSGPGGAREEANDEDLDLSDLRILVVDDVRSVRSMLAHGLSDLGAHVTEAASAEEAISVCETELARLDAVVTDFVMPGRSGLELARDVRRRRPDIPIVFLSGNPDECEIAELGAAARILAKPITLDRLALELLELLSASNEEH